MTILNTSFKYIISLACALTFILMGCEKFLDAKSDQRLVVPKNAKDLQSLLEDWTTINQRDPGAGEISSDDYYLDDNVYEGLNEYDRRMYVWDAKNLFPPGSNNDWSNGYDIIYRTNVVIFYADKLMSNSLEAEFLRMVKGRALFLRAKTYLQLAVIWCLAYDPATSFTDPGLPLRLSPNFNDVSRRANVSETYELIIKDCKEAVQLLPSTSGNVLSPTKASAYALLSRIYLAMGDYQNCLSYSDSCLNVRNELLDYNTLDSLSRFPFPAMYSTNNIEDLYNTNIIGPPRPLGQSRCRIDSNLYSLYDNNDLRKVLFFKTNSDGSHAFRGSYEGSSILYNGVSVNEVYLMNAEANARLNNVNQAMEVLNLLLAKRFKFGTFIPISAIDQKEAINNILIERRKELLMRGLRWMDIKRLNREGANIALERVVNGQIYTLPPNDRRFALPIPEDVISISGMRQNEY